VSNSFTGERVTSPWAATNEVTDVSTSGASVHGSVNDGGQQAAGGGVATYTVQYGTDPSFSTYSSQSAIVGAPGSVSAVLFGLSANTIYYYRCAATNTVGTSYGGVQSFGTTICPPLLLSPPGVGLGPPAGPITFVWQYRSGGASGGQTGYSLKLVGTVPTLGAGTWYWDGSGWTATQTWIASAAEVVTIGAAFFEINGAYSWSVATEDANGTSAYA